MSKIFVGVQRVERRMRVGLDGLRVGIGRWFFYWKVSDAYPNPNPDAHQTIQYGIAALKLPALR